MLMAEFFAGKRNSQEHVLAFYEAVEVAEIYHLWRSRVEEFPGLKKKIREAITSGPLLREGENPSTSSNRPRNDSFGFFLAGRLLDAGCEVLAVDGISQMNEDDQWIGDVTLRQDGVTFDVQCKRPQTAETVGANIEKARRQIIQAARPRMGIIAIDLSVPIRPAGTLIPADNLLGASKKLTRLIDMHAGAVTDELLGPSIAGIIWFGRIPCMVTELSRIATPTGGRYEMTRPYSAGEIAVALNASSPYIGALKSIGTKLGVGLKNQ
jgi:hypothetical protein